MCIYTRDAPSVSRIYTHTPFPSIQCIETSTRAKRDAAAENEREGRLRCASRDNPTLS